MGNRKRRKRPQGDTIKVIVIVLLAMVAMTVILIWIGNFELPERTQTDVEYTMPRSSLPSSNGESDTDNTGQDTVSAEHVFYWEHGGHLELPIKGATGWAATNIVLRAEANTSSNNVMNLTPGYAFTILDESGSWWYVRLPNGTAGWVESNRCFINFPDILPSIVYNITNASSSVFRSSGFDLPGITGLQLYSAQSYNPRLGRDEFIVPGMYSLARSLFNVQQTALSNNETIIVYEIYRPRITQRAVAAALNQLLAENEVARRAISDSSWSVGNFISQGLSNHQRGAAIDASIGNVNETEIAQSGDYSYVSVSRYTLIHAHSAMHELSPLSVRTGGNSSEAAPGIGNMQRYFTSAGFRPLSSEWWHFDHNASLSNAVSIGEFFTETIYSEPPFIN